MLEVDPRLVEERRRRGIDVRDEMWEGVLHMVPPPFSRPQGLGFELAAALRPIARSRGLQGYYETGVFRPGVDDDYRVPDLVFTRRELITERGVDGPADLVVEIRSPGDESDAKVPWYAALGVLEVLVIDRDRLAVELFRSRDGEAVLVELSSGGAVRSEVLGIEVQPVDSARIALRIDGGETVDVVVP